MVVVSSAYIAASSNRFSFAADASVGSLVAFGSGKYIALWDGADPNDRGVKQTLAGHDGLVTSVRFAGHGRLISADDKGYIRVWVYRGGEWRTSFSVHGHTSPVSAVIVFEQSVITGGSDHLVKVWSLKSDSETGILEETQSISLGGKLPITVALANFPDSRGTMLAVGATDRSIQIWVRSEDVFVHAASLPGHEDWVRSLAFQPPLSQGDPLVLASGSQDGTIRLWNIEPLSKNLIRDTKATAPDDVLTDELLDAFEASLGDLADADEGGRQISLKRHIVTLKTDENTTRQFSITFDALLVGHEAGITSLVWCPTADGASEKTLLSTSTDSSVILWGQSPVLVHDETSTIWINQQRFGDVGGQRLGGFVGGLWASGGREVLAWGWSGGWRRWRRISGGDTGKWQEVGAISGHHGPVHGIDWSPGGEYLISASPDQTTRIHGEVMSDPAGDGLERRVWHEVGRPQVHGYDLLRATFLDPLRFVSIADEKVARVFEAPRNFVSLIHHFGVVKLDADEGSRPAAASVPPLGLSNKATTDALLSSVLADQSSANARRPFEGELAAITLWPETEKVFGHGYESMALAVSCSKRLMATACKATTAEHAVIRVYDTVDWQPFGQPLPGHNLTVTRIAFSPDDRHILSVSRDRTWRLFRIQDGGDGYLPVAADKSHGRIIWDCAWAHEGDVFATASRDKTVAIWHLPAGELHQKWVPSASIKCKDACTAVAFTPVDRDGRRRLAVGLETGGILIYSGDVHSTSEWRLEVALDSTTAHIDHIYQLEWRPGGEHSIRQLASCSEDGILRVINVHVNSA